MKKILILVLTVVLIFAFTSCKSKEQRAYEEANEFFEDVYNDSYYDDDYYDDGLDDDYYDEQAGVDDGDGNYGREGEIYIEDEDNYIQLGGGEWPEDAPTQIVEPNFYGSSITAVVGNSMGMSVSYTNVQRADASDYIQTYLDSSAWTLFSHTSDSDWEVYYGQCNDLIGTFEYNAGDFYIVWE